MGITSFMLVCYYDTFSAANSSLKTVFINRLGDTFFLFLLPIWFFSGETVLGLLLIVIAAFVKSAQFPFSGWLPAAMAAPTPISALVHRSTLVAAGL